MDKVEKRRAFIINTVYTVLIISIFYLFIQYAMGVVWPFVVALFTAMILQKPVNFLEKKAHFKRGIASVVMVLAILVVAGSALGAIIYKIVLELKDFSNYLFMKLEDAPAFAQQVMAWLQHAIAFLPDSVEQSILTSANDFVNHLLGLESELAASGSQQAAQGGLDLSFLSSPLSAVWGTAKQIPMFLVGLLVCIVSSCFMTSDYKNLRDHILYQFKPDKQKALIRSKQVTFSTIGKMVKAYSAIIGITFLEMALGLFILKLCHVFSGEYIFAISFVTAIVDILPVLGTGTILIPWALLSFINGQVGLGIGLLVIYVVIGIIRQIIEPKMVAAQLGLPPYLTLAAMFIGTQLFGFIGLFLLPMTFMLLKVLNDEGIVHIYKTKATKSETPDTPIEEESSHD